MKKVLLVLLSVLMLVSCTFEPTHSPTQTENAGKGVVVLSDVPESGGEVTLVLYNEKQTQRITGTISGGNGSFTDIPADRYTSAELIVGSNHYTCGAFRVYDKKYRILGHSYYYGSEPGDYSTKLTFKSGVLTPVEPNAETVRIHFADLRSGIDEMTYGYVDADNNEIAGLITSSGVTITTVPRTQYILSELQEDGVPEVATWHAVRHLPSREELKYIDFPVDLPVIEPFVFNSCPKLEWINYPDNLEKIGEYAFFDSLNIRGNTCPCSGSSNFSVLDFKNKTALNSIGDKAFANNNSGYGSTRFRSLLLGDDLVTIGDSAFLWNAIGTLSIPKNVRIIGSHAFYKCRLLTTVELEDRTLEDLTIGAYCFSSEFTRVQDKDIYDIRLTNVCEFPSYVVIREACFSSATFLQNYTFAQDTTYIPEGTFRYCKSLQNVFLGTYRLSTGVSRSVQQIEDMGNANAGTPALKEIADQAFANCYSLKQVSLPNSLEKLGSGSFRNCRELEFVRLPDHGSKLTEIPSYAFYSSGLKTIHFPTVGEGDNATSTIRTIGAYAFAEDNNLTHINEESILVDNPDDPNGAKIEVSGLIIPNGIEEIGQYAFMRCTSVQTAAIPRSVKKMGIGVFLGCSSLERIYVGYTEQEVQQLIADGDWDYAWNAGDVKVQYKKEGE